MAAPRTKHIAQTTHTVLTGARSCSEAGVKVGVRVRVRVRVRVMKVGVRVRVRVRLGS